MLKNIVCWLFLVGSLQLGRAHLNDKYTIDIYDGNLNNLTIKSEPFIKVNDGYYYFGMDGVNWYVAYEKCRALNSELVTFETLQEFEEVSNYLKAHNQKFNYWTSGNDLGLEGSYNWFTSGQSITIPKWAPKQPDNSGGREHCIHLGYIWPYSTDFELNDRPCANDQSSLFRYICEAPEPETISIVVWK
ncbi:C-type lectin 37Da-like [Drosophila tropicalis]|uniref:C-type lectin 37Da-like n=1 Tax=Drosophila tropicalis TaxID=46794 RepID=UPI0035AB99BC